MNCLGLVGDSDGVESARPDFLRPVDEPTHLACKIAIKVAEEAGQLLLVLNHCQGMIMVREHADSTELKRRDLESSTQDADCEVDKLLGRGKQKGSMEDSVADFDQGARFGMG